MRFLTNTGRLLATLVVAFALWGGSVAQAQNTELALGAAIPMSGQSWQNAAGGQATLSSLAGSKGTVVVFWSNECPWAAKYADRFQSLAGTYAGQGFGFVLVNSNDPNAFPKESQASSRQYMQDHSLSVTYILDPSAELAKAFGAVRTPNVYVFNGSGQLAYAGTIDDSPGDPGNVQAMYLKDALDAVAGGSDVAMPRTKAFGCTIRF